MDLTAIDIIRELGGGLTAVVIVVQAWVIYILYSKNEKLLDRLVACSESGSEKTREMHEKTLSAVGALTTATQANNATAQAAVGMLERERGR